jgi:hypothetical protein
MKGIILATTSKDKGNHPENLSQDNSKPGPVQIQI